jgi:hypothetical protein
MTRCETGTAGRYGFAIHQGLRRWLLANERERAPEGLETGPWARYERRRGRVSGYSLNEPLRDLVTVVLAMGDEV